MVVGVMVLRLMAVNRRDKGKLTVMEIVKSNSFKSCNSEGKGQTIHLKITHCSFLLLFGFLYKG